MIRTCLKIRALNLLRPKNYEWNKQAFLWKKRVLTEYPNQKLTSTQQLRETFTAPTSKFFFSPGSLNDDSVFPKLKVKSVRDYSREFWHYQLIIMFSNCSN